MNRPRWLHPIGRRGSVLLFLALLDLVYAYGLAFPTPRSVTNPTTTFLLAIVPTLWFWAALWGLVGLTCLVAAKLKRLEPYAFLGAVGIKVLWALLFGLGDIAGQVERGFLSAAIWGGFSVLVLIISGWPEPPRGVKRRG